MDSDILLQIGAGGILALLMVRQVLDFLRTKKNGGHDEEIRREVHRDAVCEQVLEIVKRLEHKADELAKRRK